MVHSTAYPKIIAVAVTIDICSLIVIISAIVTGNYRMIIGHYILMVLSSLIIAFLSYTLVIKLSNELVNELEDTKPLGLDTEDIKRLGRACEKLDKYNVDYSVDYNTRNIIAHVTIGLYTRMSVANNLDSSVEYHIIGTDKVLVKQSD